LFELLILEGAQAGLSWITILRKRESYCSAFDDFEPSKIAGYGERKFAELLDNPGIIRNRLKIEAGGLTWGVRRCGRRLPIRWLGAPGDRVVEKLRRDGISAIPLWRS
jgi:hypothetical protein